MLRGSASSASAPTTPNTERIDDLMTDRCSNARRRFVRINLPTTLLNVPLTQTALSCCLISCSPCCSFTPSPTADGHQNSRCLSQSHVQRSGSARAPMAVYSLQAPVGSCELHMDPCLYGYGEGYGAERASLLA